jgi:hypothetical protein
MQLKPISAIALFVIVVVFSLVSGCTSTSNSSSSITPSIVTTPTPSIVTTPTPSLPASSQVPKTNHLSIKITQASPAFYSLFEQNDEVEVRFNSNGTFTINIPQHPQMNEGIYSINNNSISLTFSPPYVMISLAINLHNDGTCTIHRGLNDKYPSQGTYEWV